VEGLMGRQERLRRMGIVRKQAEAPDPVEYWRTRARYFEQVVLAIVDAVGGEVTVQDKDLSGLELAAEEVAPGVSKIRAVKVAEAPEGGGK
jgi:hypothetical protein